MARHVYEQQRAARAAQAQGQPPAGGYPPGPYQAPGVPVQVDPQGNRYVDPRQLQAHYQTHYQGAPPRAPPGPQGDVSPGQAKLSQMSPDEKRNMGRALDRFVNQLLPKLEMWRRKKGSPQWVADMAKKKVFAKQWRPLPKEVKIQFMDLLEMGFPEIVRTYGPFVQSQIDQGNVKDPRAVTAWRRATTVKNAYYWYSQVVEATYRVMVQKWEKK